mgnify:CR=1 FL=1
MAKKERKKKKKKNEEEEEEEDRGCRLAARPLQRDVSFCSACINSIDSV